MINAEAQLWSWPHSHWVTNFEKGATDEYEFEDVDVGTIELVVVKMEQDLRLDFTSDPDYYLEKLRVSVCMILNNRQFEKKEQKFEFSYEFQKFNKWFCITGEHTRYWLSLFSVDHTELRGLKTLNSDRNDRSIKSVW